MLRHDRPGAIAAPIVDHHDLPGKAQALQMASQLLQTRFNRCFFVESGDDDREIRQGNVPLGGDRSGHEGGV
jgi:hypothetical protein